MEILMIINLLAMLAAMIFIAIEVRKVSEQVGKVSEQVSKVAQMVEQTQKLMPQMLPGAPRA